MNQTTSCPARSWSARGAILGPPQLGWGLPEHFFEQPGEAAGIGEAVSGSDCADRYRPVGERRARRLQTDSAQRRHWRHTAAARASRRLGERKRLLRFSPEELLGPPHVPQSDVALRRRWRLPRRHPVLPATSPAIHY